MLSIKRKLPRIAAALILGGAITFTATPLRASAADLPGFVCATAPSGGNLTECVFATAVLVPTATGAELVGTCVAVVEGFVGSTGVGCELKRSDGQYCCNATSINSPGPASATLEGPMQTALQNYQICVGGNYYAFIGGGAGAPGSWVAFNCFPILI